MTAGCSMTRMSANQTAAILVKASAAYDRESDLEFAEQSGLSNLKMLEGLLEVTPDNPDLLLLTSSSFTRYAFGFIEERMEVADERYDLDEKDKLIHRSVNFYERAKEYGLRLIAQSRNKFPQVIDQDLELLSEELKHLKRKQASALFWVAYAWGSIINLQQDKPERLVEQPKVELIKKSVQELDETLLFGVDHIYNCAYYGGRAEMLGGNPSEAKRHLERAIEISNGKYLMARFLLARYYCVPVQNREMFERTLEEVISAPPDLFPEQRLANELAKRRAKRWLERADKLFF